MMLLPALLSFLFAGLLPTTSAAATTDIGIRGRQVISTTFSVIYITAGDQLDSPLPLATVSVVTSSTINTLGRQALPTPAVADIDIVAQLVERQTSTTTSNSPNCPAIPNSDSLYKLDLFTVTLKNGELDDIAFSIYRDIDGDANLVCTPDYSILDNLEDGERFECNGFGNGRYEFAYTSGNTNAIWLRYDGYAHSALVGTALVPLTCKGNICTNTCPVYIIMLDEDPDD